MFYNYIFPIEIDKTSGTGAHFDDHYVRWCGKFKMTNYINQFYYILCIRLALF